MLLPVTGSMGWGAMCLFERDESHGNAWRIETWGSCGFYPCHGARDPITEHALDVLFSDRSLLSGARLLGRWKDDGFSYETM